MDPITIIGATASVAQLLGLSQKTAAFSRSLAESIINAPAEIGRLAAKLEGLKLLIEQIQKLCDEVSDADTLELFPSAHQELTYGCLRLNYDALQGLKSIQVSNNTGSMGLQWRIRWAAVDKRKARTILAQIGDAQMMLDVVLSVLGVRIGSLNQTSLATLRLSQANALDNLTREVQEIRVNLCQEIISSVTERNETMETFEAIEALRNDVRENSGELKQLSNSFLAVKGRFHGVVENGKGKQPQGQMAADNVTRTVGGELQACEGTVIKTEATSRSRPEPRNLSPSAQFDKESEFNMNIQARILEHTYRRVLHEYSWVFGTSKELLTPKTIKPYVNTAIKRTSKHSIRNTRITVVLAFRLIHQHILHFELRVRSRIRNWLSVPWLGCSLTVVNIRESDAPIFQACSDWDLETVRFLLESGRAGLHDVDSETRCGLLEFVFRVNDVYTHNNLLFSNAGFRGQLVLQYLLDRGYDPNFFHGMHCLPASLMAFHYCLASSVSLLVHHGAQLDSFQMNPSTILTGFNARGYHWQLHFLRSLGFSDWKVDDNCHSLLHDAAESGDLDGVLFLLEIVDQDPNTMDHWGHTPLSNAVRTNQIAIPSMLVEKGAQVNVAAWSGDGPPLNRAMRFCAFDAVHWLLFNGADPTLQDLHSQNIWYIFWGDILFEYRSNLEFIILEGLLAHLLLHHADPFQPDEYHPCEFIFKPQKCDHSHPLYCSYSGMRAPEFARAWSLISGTFAFSQGAHTDEERLAYEDEEANRIPLRSISWSSNGIINGLDENDGSRGDLDDNSDDVSGENSDDDSDGCYDDEQTERQTWEGSVKYLGEDDDTYRDYGRWMNEYNIHSFQNTTMFYQTISTEEGRDQMSTFPVVRMLCNALILAGYRAEMDKEGDIWYEDEDGDMYYDALEYPLAEDSDKEHLTLCPICKDPERYGLGHIIRESEYGKERLRQYREEVKKHKRTYF